MKIIFFYLCVLSCNAYGYRRKKFRYHKKFPMLDIKFNKHKLQLKNFLAKKHLQKVRKMPDFKLDKNGYYNQDEYRKFLRQPFIKDRKNDVLSFKSAHIFKEHNLYHPTQHLAKKIKKKIAFKKFQKKKMFERANAWKAFKKLGMKKSFLKHMPTKRERKLKQKKNFKSKKFDIVLKKFQELFGNHKQNERKLKEQKKSSFIQRQALIQEIKDQNLEIKKLEKKLKKIKKAKANPKKYQFKPRLLLKQIKKINKERRLEQTFYLKNIEFGNVQFDFDFLNGKSSALQYSYIKTTGYQIENSFKNIQFIQGKIFECYQILSNNFNWSQFDINENTKQCRSYFANMMMILRNVFLYTEKNILKVLPNKIYEDNKEINKKDFFLHLIEQQQFEFDTTIYPISNSIEKLNKILSRVLRQENFINYLMKIKNITKDFSQLKFFAQHLGKPNLYAFLLFLENECNFYQQLQMLSDQYALTDEGKQFLKNYIDQIQARNLAIKTNNQQKDKKGLTEVTNFLKSKFKNYQNILKNEKTVFDMSKGKIPIKDSTANKDQILLKKIQRKLESKDLFLPDNKQKQFLDRILKKEQNINENQNKQDQTIKASNVAKIQVKDEKQEKTIQYNQIKLSKVENWHAQINIIYQTIIRVFDYFISSFNRQFFQAIWNAHKSNFSIIQRTTFKENIFLI